MESAGLESRAIIGKVAGQEASTHEFDTTCLSSESVSNVRLDECLGLFGCSAQVIVRTLSRLRRPIRPKLESRDTVVPLAARRIFPSHFIPFRVQQTKKSDGFNIPLLFFALSYRTLCRTYLHLSPLTMHKNAGRHPTNSLLASWHRAPRAHALRDECARRFRPILLGTFFFRNQTTLPPRPIIVYIRPHSLSV